MSNMSYCQFENTSKDLEQCRETISEMVYGETEKLSKSELKFAKHLVESCYEILEILADSEFGECDFSIKLDELQEELPE